MTLVIPNRHVQPFFIRLSFEDVPEGPLRRFLNESFLNFTPQGRYTFAPEVSGFRLEALDDEVVLFVIGPAWFYPRHPDLEASARNLERYVLRNADVAHRAPIHDNTPVGRIEEVAHALIY